MKNLFMGSFSRGIEKFHSTKAANMGPSHIEMHGEVYLAIAFVVHSLPRTKYTFVEIIIVNA